MKPVDIALVGLGGYGSYYIGQLLPRHQQGEVRIVGGIDPKPELCKQLDALEAAGVPIFADLSEFFGGSSAELVIISAPIHLHCPLTCISLEQGANVLCEKPVAATVQEADEMKAAERKAGKFVAIGYQWAYSDAIQQLKRDVMAGDFGRPERLLGCTLWPRKASYYARNNWAGALKTPAGRYVLDSPINNATAHYLQVMLYVLGQTRETAAQPVEIEAELYRANNITNFDTGALRCRLADGTELVYMASHAVEANTGPLFRWEFEKAVVEYPTDGPATMRASLADGEIREYGNPYATQDRKVEQVLAAVRTGEPVACGIEAARPQTLCINGAQDSVPEIVRFPQELIKVNELEGGDTLTYVDGLHAAMLECFKEGIMPYQKSELTWTKRGRRIDLRDYRGYPSKAG